MLTLELVKLPENLRGIYGPNKDKLGKHQLFAHPDLAGAIARTEAQGLRLIYSDIFRSAKSSLESRRAKPGLVQPPAFSAHNYGLAVDLDVGAILKEQRLDKKRLDTLLATFGLYCHRLDHALGAESWHYNALGPDAAKWLGFAQGSTARSIETKILALYGASFSMAPDEVKAALQALGFIDLKQLQIFWDLVPDGVAGPKTRRLLAYLTAKTEYK